MFKLTKSVDQVIFDFFLFVLFSSAAFISSGFKPLARELPLPVAIIGTFLTLALLLTDISPYLNNKLKFIDFKVSGIKGTEILNKVDDTHEHPTEWLRFGRTVLWLILYVLAINYIGYLVATFCFVILMTWLEGKLKLRTSLLSGIGSILFFYVMFNLILKATF